MSRLPGSREKEQFIIGLYWRHVTYVIDHKESSMVFNTVVSANKIRNTIILCSNLSYNWIELKLTNSVDEFSIKLHHVGVLGTAVVDDITACIIIAKHYDIFPRPSGSPDGDTGQHDPELEDVNRNT